MHATCPSKRQRLFPYLLNMDNLAICSDHLNAAKENILGLLNSGLKRPCNCCLNSCNSSTPHEKNCIILLEKEARWRKKTWRLREHRKVTWGRAMRRRTKVFKQTASTGAILEDPPVLPSSADSWVQLCEWIQQTPCEAERLSHSVLPEFLTHRIMSNKMMVALSHYVLRKHVIQL